MKNLERGDLVVPRNGELAGKVVEVIDIINHTIIAATMDKVIVERNDGVILIVPYNYSVSGLYQMFDVKRYC